ncbi:TWiK family of potassium channels protein 7 [Nilaparvata lugens]|uniref:TWiK family of potassium channels protein 7 n=1 Tax=Nilaparvata lugens TaxID=108931 RepID=UPI00193EADA6|nr:TWiK family of potassium channels protein 7 [Nilaparvata lugens]XP_039297513.1 TWiK family of potassium channels protein 7 [Nilaparvata lugens]
MLGQDCREYHHYQQQAPPSVPAATASSCPPSSSILKKCSSKQKKLSCCSLISSLLSSVGICLLVVAYTVLGAITFTTLEAESRSGIGTGTGSNTVHTAAPPSDDKLLRSQTVEKLWSITEDLNILYKENWTRLAEQEVLKFQDSLVRRYKKTTGAKTNHIWSFASSFLYSLTLITTIGYGSISPRTSWGRLMTIIYALIGIPLMLVYLSTVGDSLAKNFRRLYARFHCSSSNSKSQKKTDMAKPALQNHIPVDKKSDNMIDKMHNIKMCVAGEVHSPYHIDSHQQRVPISITLSVVIVYISGGALLFNRLENWTFLEGSFFCFTSLGTIGFGELVPGTIDSNSEEISVFISSAYILIGMAVIAMCFNLVQDETVLFARKVMLWMQRNDKMTKEEPDAVAMSVVPS